MASPRSPMTPRGSIQQQTVLILALSCLLPFSLVTLGTCEELLRNRQAEVTTPAPANRVDACVEPAEWTRLRACIGPMMYGVEGHPAELKAGGGIAFFYGGCHSWETDGSYMEQVSQLPPWTARPGRMPRVSLSGYLGGREGDEDTMLVTSEFLDSNPAVNVEARILGKIQIGPVRNRGRNNKTAMVLKKYPRGNTPVYMPKGSTFIRTRVACINFPTPGENCCDAYADLLSLKIW